MTSFESGGTERQMVELMTRLDRTRWQVHVACLHARGRWLRRAIDRAATIAEFPIRSFKELATARHCAGFADWCRARRIAVLHTTDFYANVFGLPTAALARVPVRIANRREINPDKTSGQILTQRAAYAFAHKVVANSRAAADRLRRERLPARKVAIIANGLDVSRFAPGPARPAGRRVVVVANLRPEKGHDVLLDAAAMVLREMPDAAFEIVGDGPESGRLRAHASALGLARSVRFLGHEDRVETRLAGADVFVLPSRSEAMPNAVLEAMSAGLAVVASAVGGIVEVVESGRTGLLVPPGDAPAFAREILRLLADPALATRLGRSARDEIVNRHSFDRMVAAFDDVYVAELNRRGVAVPELQPVAC
jgi:glycosyltransferase involved in cell wall biosynthesis